METGSCRAPVLVAGTQVGTGRCPEADGPRHCGRRALSCYVHHDALSSGGRTVIVLHRRLLGEDVCFLLALPFHN